MKRPNPRALLRFACKDDLITFLQIAFRVLEPHERLILAPYIKLLCAALMSLDQGMFRRLVINIPPRHLKSIVTSIVFPAWLLLRDPRKKIAVITHSDMLANNLASKLKRLIASPEYRKLAPHVRIRPDRESRTDFETSQGGGVFAASISSGVTGRGFDCIIIDDPLSAQNRNSEVERRHVHETFDGMIGSRLDNPVKGSIIVVHQRLHEDDLSGYLMLRGGWEILSLPLVADEEREYAHGNYRWRRPAEDVLLPERFPRYEIERIRAHHGEAIFAAQWQQNPSAMHGELIKDHHLTRVDYRPPSAKQTFISVDTAVKQTVTSDYSVFLVIATDGTRHYVVDIVRKRLDPVQLRETAKKLMAEYGSAKMLIEDSASGPGLHHMLKEIGIKSELCVVGRGNKEERLEKHLHNFVDGRIYVVANQPWTNEFCNELVKFPTGRYDDQVDALTLYLEHVASTRPVLPCLAVALASDGDLTYGQQTRHLHKGEHPMRPQHRRKLW